MEEKIIQEKRTFFEELVHFLKKKCGRDMEIDFREIIKTNDTKIPTIAMMKKEKNAVGCFLQALFAESCKIKM